MGAKLHVRVFNWPQENFCYSTYFVLKQLKSFRTVSIGKSFSSVSLFLFSCRIYRVRWRAKHGYSVSAPLCVCVRQTTISARPPSCCCCCRRRRSSCCCCCCRWRCWRRLLLDCMAPSLPLSTHTHTCCRAAPYTAAKSYSIIYHFIVYVLRLLGGGGGGGGRTWLLLLLSLLPRETCKEETKKAKWGGHECVWSVCVCVDFVCVLARRRRSSNDNKQKLTQTRFGVPTLLRVSILREPKLFPYFSGKRWPVYAFTSPCTCTRA